MLLLWKIYLCAMFGCFVPSGLAGVCGQRSKTQRFFSIMVRFPVVWSFTFFFLETDFSLYYVLCFPLYDSFNWYSIIIGFQWTDKSSRHLLQSSSCTLCGVSVFWDQLHYRLSHYSSPPTKSLQRGAEKAKPSCFSPLEVSSWLKCWEVEVNQLLTLRVILSFMVCFNQ